MHHAVVCRAATPKLLPLPHAHWGKSLEEYSEELDLLTDPALEGTQQQYDPFYDVWQTMSTLVASYENAREVCRGRAEAMPSPADCSSKQSGRLGAIEGAE